MLLLQFESFFLLISLCFQALGFVSSESLRKLQNPNSELFSEPPEGFESSTWESKSKPRGLNSETQTTLLTSRSVAPQNVSFTAHSTQTGYSTRQITSTLSESGSGTYTPSTGYSAQTFKKEGNMSSSASASTTMASRKHRNRAPHE